MDQDQDWTTITLKKKITSSKPAINISPATIALRKLEDNDTIVKQKLLSHESKQLIVSYRIEHKLSQSGLDNLCSFPKNTIQHLESNKRGPSNSELQMLNRLLKTPLKLS